MAAELFQMLDLDGDGFLSRTELNRAAKRYGWSWREAPVFAVLDLLSIPAPIPKSEFIAYFEQIRNDPLGPYGKVLLNSLHFSHPASSRNNRTWQHETRASEDRKGKTGKRADLNIRSTVELLADIQGADIAANFQSLVDTLESRTVPADESALLIIDPQRSFTEGAWMRSMGIGAAMDVAPIRLAFGNCAKFLNRYGGLIEVLFTRCPFPVDSYTWDDRLSDLIGDNQPYFIKPGNSVLFPSDNGFERWVGRCVHRGKKTLVMGGCTLNSCVRVSSIETQRKFQYKQVQVVVDLSLAGARAGNYIASPVFKGLSAVESAVKQMQEAGVHVAGQVDWDY